MLRVRALLGAVLGLALLGGCSASPATLVVKTRPTSPVPVLKAAWSAKPVLRKRDVLDNTPWAWTTSDAFIVTTQSGVTAYGPDGTVRWTVTLPGEITLASPTLTNGVAAVVLTRGPEGAETYAVAAVDTTAGRVLWRTPVAANSLGINNIDVGPAAVVATSECGLALSLAVHTGAVISRVPDPSASDCSISYASDGTTIVGADRGTVDNRLVGYAAATGRRIWTMPVTAAHSRFGPSPRIRGVLSSDPLIVDLAVGGHRFLRVVDPATASMRVLGRETTDSWVTQFQAIVDGRLLVQYGQSSQLFAYDPTTGTELHRTPLGRGETAIGVRDGRVITVQPGGGPIGDAALAVGSVDPVTGDEQVLAAMSIDGVAAFFGRGTGFDAAVSGDVLAVTTLDGVAAYRLPTSGKELSALPDPTKWAAGDVRPATVSDLCAGVTATTLRTLGFADPELPAPANCDWSEITSSDNFRMLAVGASAIAPTDKASAVEAAKQDVVKLTQPDTLNKFPALDRLPGVGDEAWIGSATTSSKSFRHVSVVARVRNVVITVTVTSDMYEKPAPFSTLIAAGKQAAVDAVAELNRRI